MSNIFIFFSPVQIIPILTEWLDLIEIGKLDSAVCNKSQRFKLLEFMKKPFFNVNSTNDAKIRFSFSCSKSTCLMWLEKRSIKYHSNSLSCKIEDISGHEQFFKLFGTDGLSLLKSFQHLISLTIDFTGSQSCFLKQISWLKLSNAMPNLQKLTIKRLPHKIITGSFSECDVLVGESGPFISLTELTLSDFRLEQQSDSFLIFANKLERLVSVNITNVRNYYYSENDADNDEDEAEKHLKQLFARVILFSSHSLLHINFNNNAIVSNEIVNMVLAACHNIITLNLGCCDKLSDEIMYIIVVDNNCKQLSELNIKGCGYIDLSGWIAVLNKNCTKLTKISASRYSFDQFTESQYPHIKFHFSGVDSYNDDDDGDNYNYEAGHGSDDDYHDYDEDYYD